MLTAIICLISLSGSANPQRITLQFTNDDIASFSQDLNLSNPTTAELQKQACNHLQLAIEITAGQ